VLQLFIAQKFEVQELNNLEVKDELLFLQGRTAFARVVRDC
jgi:hypothetical protein